CRAGRERSPPACSSRTRSTRRARSPPSDHRTVDGPRKAVASAAGPCPDADVSERVLQLWFEFASTYSHPAVQRVEALAAERGVRVGWRPFLLGPIFQRQGWTDSPFNLYPVKGRYMWRDLERVCAKHGIPFRRPSVFPRPSLVAARVACAAQDEPWGAAF